MHDNNDNSNGGGILDDAQDTAGDVGDALKADWEETKDDVNRVKDGVDGDDVEKLKENRMLGNDGDK